ncbi:restriction endonuclease [Lapidilactobacillus concavus DSM 17758]|uniref:Restriction endonuclease n=1 Tax=Lapidilactobacillus concavus DSM 17758 TaxID=1423735 RepID=A0A0R1W8E8_9LACO|nr:HNH endonuclease signature motif containing protein [Lapidilactobacillus concavus]KRM13874.1 restriction endonuclease [Lapidilactobacillus concavus DSM 17758]GEL13167.1 restriction endonuclease [Lapidilactobacillus concavus]
MRLKCQYCRLTLDQQHFMLGEKQLTSICDICQVRGLPIGEFENGPIEQLALARQSIFLGLPSEVRQSSQNRLALTKKEQRACMSLINGFDALTIATQHDELQHDFYRRIIQWQDHPDHLVITGNIPEDIANLGCDTAVLFDKNNLDFTTRAYIREKYQYRCQYCGRYGDSVDHKNPVTFSNDNRIENLTLSCRECNKLKGSMPYQLFKQWNAEIPAVLARLREFEQTLHNLAEQQKRQQNRLAVQSHLTTNLRDPQLMILRQKIKSLQGLIDGEMSDYQKMIAIRHDYVLSHYEAWQLERKG